MHFTWPAWDKAQSRLSILVKFVCVASVSVFRGNPCRERKNAFFVWENADAKFREAHAGSAHMHFTWPAWDKTQSRLALFVNLFCVASVLRKFETSARLEFVVLCPVDCVVHGARPTKADKKKELEARNPDRGQWKRPPKTKEPRTTMRSNLTRPRSSHAKTHAGKPLSSSPQSWKERAARNSVQNDNASLTYMAVCPHTNIPEDCHSTSSNISNSSSSRKLLLWLLPCSQNAVEHARYSSVGMDALFSNALDHGRHQVVGMDALFTRRTRPWTS